MTPQLPNSTIISNSELTTAFVELGCNDFHKACDYVHKLAYGRNSQSDDFIIVLTEKKGTCSTKHALLKALADELHLSIQLTLGIYAMNELNTPGVGVVLDGTDLEYVPEAHCYLTYDGERYDFTRADSIAEQPINNFFVEMEISPKDIGQRKKDIHKAFIKEHYSEFDVDTIWKVREQCILALSN